MEISLRDLADRIGGRLEGPGEVRIRGVGGLQDAEPGQVAFLANPRYAQFLATTRASAVIVAPGIAVDGPAAIRADNPDLAFAKAVEIFAPPAVLPPAGIHATAVVAPGARLGAGVSAGPHAVVEAGAEVGPRSILGAGVYLGALARVGSDCRLYPGVVVRERCVLGDRVIVHSGTVIGADGFGYSQEKGVHVKIPQVGIVQIDDDVEIGANAAIDRARFGRTWIQRGTKIDNLVQIGHNAVIGEDVLIVSQTGLAGSARIGNRATVGGQAGVVGHVTVGEGAMVAGRAKVTKDVRPGAVVSGDPAGPHERQQRLQAMLRKLPKLIAGRAPPSGQERKGHA